MFLGLSIAAILVFLLRSVYSYDSVLYEQAIKKSLSA